MNKDNLDIFYPKNKEEWREWLIQNHQEKQSIWILYYKKQSNSPSITWSDAVDEAICFGWIDSTRKKWTENSFIQFFSKRNPKSAWSKINKQKVERLIGNNLLMPAGYKSIEIAKNNGSWMLLDEVESLIIPQDFEKALALNIGSKDRFLSLNKSQKKIFLHQLLMAKRPETRQKRINEILEFLKKI